MMKIKKKLAENEAIVLFTYTHETKHKFFISTMENKNKNLDSKTAQLIFCAKKI